MILVFRRKKYFAEFRGFLAFLEERKAKKAKRGGGKRKEKKTEEKREKQKTQKGLGTKGMVFKELKLFEKNYKRAENLALFLFLSYNSNHYKVNRKFTTFFNKVCCLP